MRHSNRGGRRHQLTQGAARLIHRRLRSRIGGAQCDTGCPACGLTTIIAVDVKGERLELAQKLGATHVIDSGSNNAVEEIQRITGGGAEYSLECTGIPAVFRQSVDALAMTGVCGLIGVAPFGMEVSLDMQTILNGRTIRGIVEGDSIPTSLSRS